MKNFLLIIVFLSVFSCASHNSIKMADLSSNISAQDQMLVQNDVEVIPMPVHTKDDLRKYYDEDLILYGVLPIQVSINYLGQNKCYLGIEYASLIDPKENVYSPMDLDHVYEKTKKSYWRSAGWGIAFGLVGALPSLFNVASINEKIRADYDSCMLKSSEMVNNSHVEGTVFFPVSNEIATLDGWKFKIGFEKEGETFYFIFNLAGHVEQPRIRKID